MALHIRLPSPRADCSANVLAERSPLGVAQTSDPLQNATTNTASLVHKIPFGQYLPVMAFYIFRNDAEVRECLLDIVFAALGIFASPLYFTFHMFKLLQTPGALIVVTSLTHNVARLSVVSGGPALVSALRLWGCVSLTAPI